MYRILWNNKAYVEILKSLKIGFQISLQTNSRNGLFSDHETFIGATMLEIEQNSFGVKNLETELL